MTDYFSDRENGPGARTEQVISPTVWAGLVGTVPALIYSGASACGCLRKAAKLQDAVVIDCGNLWGGRRGGVGFEWPSAPFDS